MCVVCKKDGIRVSRKQGLFINQRMMPSWAVTTKTWNALGGRVRLKMNTVYSH